MDQDRDNREQSASAASSSSSPISSGRRKRTRTSAPKVRTGCITCKIRHVKCDEQRPECNRCINIGIRCGGYPHLKTVSSSDTQDALSSAIPRSLQRMPSQNARERQSLEFFYFKMAPNLGGYFHKPFWNEKILSLSLEEPSVRVAVIAFASLYEIVLKRMSAPDEVSEAQERFALEYHNRAIREIVSKLDNPGPIRVPLTVCVLFFCIDSLRGDLTVAFKHVRGGLKLLEIWRERSRNLKAGEDEDMLADFEFIENGLSYIFYWMNLLSCVLGGRYFNIKGKDSGLAHPTEGSEQLNLGPFEDLDESQDSLMQIVEKGVSFVHLFAGTPLAVLVANEEHVQMHRTLLGYYEEWGRSYEKLLAEKQSQWDEALRYGANLVRSSYMTMSLWLKGYFFVYESEWDQYRKEYEEIVECTEKVIDNTLRFPNMESKFFSFEIIYIPGLQFVASKCRFPTLRRKALRLLRACPQKEAVFDSKNSEVLYRRVMELEEAAIPGLQPGAIPRDDQLPPDSARVQKIEMPPIPPTSRGTTVNFYTKPEGPLGPWSVRAEYLDLSSPLMMRWIDGKYGAWEVEFSLTQTDQSGTNTPSLLQQGPLLGQTNMSFPIRDRFVAEEYNEESE